MRQFRFWEHWIGRENSSLSISIRQFSEPQRFWSKKIVHVHFGLLSYINASSTTSVLLYSYFFTKEHINQTSKALLDIATKEYECWNSREIGTERCWTSREQISRLEEEILQLKKSLSIIERIAERRWIKIIVIFNFDVLLIN